MPSMDKIRPAHVPAFIGWLFVAWESYALLTRSIAGDWLAIVFWVFFFLVALIASALASAGERKHEP